MINDHQNPLVSIVIPTFNMRPEFLRQTVASALAQTYKNIEVIVSENHSTNGAPAVLQEFSDPRLKVVRPPEHLPMTPHFQFASSHATGEYFSFLCSDDLVTPDWLETLVPKLAAVPEAVFAFGEVSVVQHENLENELYRCRDDQMPSGFYSAQDMLRVLIGFDRTSAWLIGDLMRTDAYFKAGGMDQQGVKYCADYALAIRLLEQGGAVYINQLVGRYRHWGIGDGKTDASRFIAAIDDTAALYHMLDQSEILRPLIARMGMEYLWFKEKKARTLALLVIEGSALGEIDQNQAKIAAAKIKEMSEVPAVRLLLALASNQIALKVVSVFYKPIRRAVRSWTTALRSRQLRSRQWRGRAA